MNYDDEDKVMMEAIMRAIKETRMMEDEMPESGGMSVEILEIIPPDEMEDDMMEDVMVQDDMVEDEMVQVLDEEDEDEEYM